MDVQAKVVDSETSPHSYYPFMWRGNLDVAPSESHFCPRFNHPTVADTQSQQMVSLAGQLRNPSLECNSDFGFILRMPKYTKKHNSEVFPVAFRSRQIFRGFRRKVIPPLWDPRWVKTLPQAHHRSQYHLSLYTFSAHSQLALHNC